MVEEVPLPGMPEPPARRSRPKQGVTRVGRIKARHLCHKCCWLIHALGQAQAPYPNVARWRIYLSDSTVDMCEAHKDEYTE